MAFSFELKLAISSELYGAISAGPEHTYQIVVEDTGIGMSEHFLEHLFDP